MLRKAVGQDAAFEEGVKLVFDERRHVGADSVFCLGEVSGSALRCASIALSAPYR